MTNPIGTMVRLTPHGELFSGLLDLGLRCCQLVSWEPSLWSAERAAEVKREMEEKRITVTAFWAGWEGPRVWDFASGPSTLGIVPPAYRFVRSQTLKAAAAFAIQAGLPAVITHLGFIPENPNDGQFHEVVAVVRDIAEHYAKLGAELWLETGQETPVVMLRLIQAVGTSHLGVNLDPANLILYGKGNPVDAIDVLGKLVRNVHAKDGLYPTDPMKLGTEVTVGTGRVDFPRLVDRLGQIGFTGAYIIEREISGERQIVDIREAAAYLTKLLA